MGKPLKNDKKIWVFTDFDGTITHKDLGDELFKRFGEFEPHHSKLMRGELKIEEYWRILAKSLRRDLTPADIAKFAENCETDANFPDFARFCEKESLPLAVVSDGFRVYISPVLERLGLVRLPAYCNELQYKDGVFKPEFPGATESCSCPCASCKRNAVLNFAPEDAIYVYIGDGLSDFCAAEHCDIIFAKKSLAAHLNEKRIPHYPFANFFDVRRLLGESIANGKAKVRRQAQLLRKKAFEIE